MTTDLPTARVVASTGFRIHVWCKACRHAVDADTGALIRDGRGDIPLIHLKWRCGNCGSGLTRISQTREQGDVDWAALCEGCRI